MKVIWADQQWEGLEQPTSIALGFFDGFHKGHEAVLDATMKLAQEKNCTPVVLTFDRHPWEILHSDKKPERLMSLEDKSRYLEKYGFSQLVFIKLTADFLRLEAQEFFAWILKKLQPLSIVSGPNYTFGNMKKGDCKLLSALGKEHGVTVITTNYVENKQLPVSSTRIRTFLKKGEVDVAAALLGRYYHLDGTIITGDGRGRQLGFPTANFKIDPLLILPINGVYGVKVRIGDSWFNGAASIGTNPTFSGERTRRLEVNILDVDQDLYGQTLRVAFCHFQRSEATFNSKEELICQMNKDVEETRRRLTQEFDYGMLPNW